MQCPLCQAFFDESRGDFIVSHGAPMSAKKMNSRVCHYARERGREGCINQCTEIDKSETLEGRIAFVDTALRLNQMVLADDVISAIERKRNG